MCFPSSAQTNRRKVHAYIQEHPEGVKVSQMAADLGLPMEEVRGHVRRLHYEGHVSPVSPKNPRGMMWRSCRDRST